MNWLANGGDVTVTDTALSGYIWSAGFGWINLSPTNGGVANSSGTLSGSAWSTNTGWIDFTGVTIDSSGVFHGHTTAQSTFGTMTFDCTNCHVVTSWHAPASSSGGGGGSTGGGNGQVVDSAASAPSSIVSTTTDNQSLIFSLQAQIQSLIAQLTALTAARGVAATSSGSRTFTFSRNLQLNDTGGEVKALQQYLNSHSSRVASSGPGSPGNETMYFGVATYRALRKFQEKRGLLPTGYFGTLTKTLVNSLPDYVLASAWIFE